jgi:hypothetical protein
MVAFQPIKDFPKKATTNVDSRTLAVSERIKQTPAL